MTDQLHVADHRRTGPPEKERVGVPKVVIFDQPAGPRVDVVRLRSPMVVGECIEHLGKLWRVTEQRTHGRVLICKPIEA